MLENTENDMGFLKQVDLILKITLGIIHAIVATASFIAVAGAGIGCGLLFDSRIACAVGGSAVMFITGVIGDRRSAENVRALQFGTTVACGMIAGFLTAIIVANVYSF